MGSVSGRASKADLTDGVYAVASGPKSPETSDVLGVPISLVDIRRTVSILNSWIEKREGGYVCVTGVHGVMESARDPELLEIHRAAGLVVPDGVPLVWIARRRGCSQIRRVYGPDLMLAACRSSVELGHRHFFFGGAFGVPELLARRLGERFPGLRVVGTHSPPFRPLSPAEDQEVVDKINEADPDFVWVGLSTPKQERWMATHVQRLSAPVLVGVGAAFDFHAGLKRQAPSWMQRSGLEWLFRMLSEPRRLGPRYLRNNPAFVCRLIRQSLRAGEPMLDSSRGGR